MTPDDSAASPRLDFGPYTFTAVRVKVSDGRLCPLSGHVYAVTVRLHTHAGLWSTDGAATNVLMSVQKVIAPLRGRTLVARHPVAGRCLVDDRQVTLEDGHERYSLPVAHVVLLPVANTTIELLAGYLLGGVGRELSGMAGLTRIELTLAESPQLAVTLSLDPRDDDRPGASGR